jgi:hypothetical protein
MGSKSTIEQRDGQTVLVTQVSSEAKARELAASIEDDVLRTESGWWGAARAKIDAGFRIGSQILETVDRSYLVLICVGFGAVACVLAALSWPAFVPIQGIEWLIGFAGCLLVFAIGYAAHQVWKAFKADDEVEGYGLIVGMVVGVLLNLFASVALQARIAVENDTGWTEIKAQIVRLDNERGQLQIQTFSPPKPGEAARIQAAIDALRSSAAVNRLNDPLTQTVDELVGDCSVVDDYYKRKYCPELTRLAGDLTVAAAAERAYNLALARIKAIDAEIVALQARRPRPPAGLELLRLVLQNFAAVAPFVPPALFSVSMELLMILFGVLAGRRAWKRRQL